jgi:hypothetical protein
MLCSAVSQAGAQAPPKTVVTGLMNPESVVVTPQGLTVKGE